MTAKEIVLEVAATFGKIDLQDDMIEFIIWERTGFPCFYSKKKGETNESCLRRQVEEYFLKYYYPVKN